jgi:hypothetical protein
MDTEYKIKQDTTYGNSVSDLLGKVLDSPQKGPLDLFPKNKSRIVR